MFMCIYIYYRERSLICIIPFFVCLHVLPHKYYLFTCLAHLPIRMCFLFLVVSVLFVLIYDILCNFASLWTH